MKENEAMHLCVRVYKLASILQLKMDIYRHKNRNSKLNFASRELEQQLKGRKAATVSKQ